MLISVEFEKLKDGINFCDTKETTLKNSNKREKK